MKWVVGAISALSEERDEIDASRTRETFASASRDMSVGGGRSNEEGGESSRLRDGAGAMGPNVLVSEATVRARPTGYLPGRPPVNLLTGMGYIVQYINCLPSKVRTSHER